MQDMRFNSLPDKIEEIYQKTENKAKRSRWFLALILLAVFGLGIVIFGFGSSLSGLFYLQNSSAHYALFLTNGQVYFGKIVKQNKAQIVLKEVFYLQSEKNAEAEGSPPEAKVSLIKLGQELHGPTDKLFVNQSQVLFYEKLRDDSKVVEAIKNYKQ